MSDELEKLERKLRRTPWIEWGVLTSSVFAWAWLFSVGLRLPLMMCGAFAMGVLVGLWERDRERRLKEEIRKARLRKYREETGTDG